ncbi:PPE domain-containing protein [Antrihabitans sp. YC2-6]|uniref:PPE domain-containing protein n=1 Tax=Antrihabitans sp. YC2-6 TaxID=2799498 RepID=UPI0018F72621|nr:PPE domain-containing protein [Antrihabitans sp. YC2-6]MBJ8345637.1 PPE domain-containing protein [Antrihabitans sp. YC2-6]
MSTFDELNAVPGTRASLSTDDVAGIMGREFSHLARENKRLRSQYAGTTDPPAIVTPEDFVSMPYVDMYARVSGISSNGLNAVANVWRDLATTASTAAADFQAATTSAMEDKWTGRAAEAVASGIADFLTGFADLPTAMTTTANGIDVFEAKLAFARLNVPPPPVTDVDPSAGWPEWGGDAKEVQHEAAEIMDRARTAMATVYRPGVETVDNTTILLPPPFNPVAGSSNDLVVSGGGDLAGQGGQTGGSIGSQIAEHGGGATSVTTDQTGVGSDGQSGESGVAGLLPADATVQATVNPRTNSGFVDDAVTPKSWLEDPLGRNANGDNNQKTSGQYGGILPGGGAGDRAGSGRSGTNGGPVVGRGTPAAPAVPVPKSAPGVAAGRSGMHGMPGGVAPGAGRNKADDDSEHKTPSYLVNVDNGNELIGPIRKVAPPVIGA